MNGAIIINRDNESFLWIVTSNNINPCLMDIKQNYRSEHSEYTKEMFRQHYGCHATLEIVRTV